MISKNDSNIDRLENIFEAAESFIEIVTVRVNLRLNFGNSCAFDQKLVTLAWILFDFNVARDVYFKAFLNQGFYFY